MKKKIISSLIATIVYTGIFALFQTTQEETLSVLELLMGALAFFIAFLISQTIIARKKQKQLEKKDK